MFVCAVFALGAEDIMPGRTVVEAVPDGWWYAARLPGRKAVVTFCCEQSFARDKNLRQAAAWQRQLAATAWLKDQLPPSFLTRSPLERASGDGAAADMTIVCRAAPSSLLSAPFGNAWLAVGDAACSYDPITSAGWPTGWPLAATQNCGPTASASWLISESMRSCGPSFMPVSNGSRTLTSGGTVAGLRRHQRTLRPRIRSWINLGIRPSPIAPDRNL